MGEDSLKKSDISVTTTNGVVTLDGSASGSHAKSAAEAATKSVAGVRSVDNNLETPANVPSAKVLRVEF
jgi:hyperosmotically inducible periplasmic protein